MAQLAAHGQDRLHGDLGWRVPAKRSVLNGRLPSLDAPLFECESVLILPDPGVIMHLAHGRDGEPVYLATLGNLGIPSVTLRSFVRSPSGDL